MHLHHLTLANLRNYVRLDLRLQPGLTVIRGDNAQGKTNLLEAIYYLSTTRSFRARTDGELVHWLAWREDQPYARLVGQIETGSGDLQIELTLMGTRRADDSDTPPAVRKHIKVNGAKCRAVDLVGQFPVVMFSPVDLALVDGQPALRRRYLDVALSQVSRRYVRSLSRYNRVLQQRNHLLRGIRDGGRRPGEQLAFWDAELAEHGGILVSERLTAIHALNNVVADLHPQLTDQREHLRILYQCSFDLGGREARYALSPDEISTRLRDALAQARREELARGVSVVGPHRDDLRFVANEADMGVYGSRGQQRTVALALKLAEVSFMRQRLGEPPTLLLDDVLSELDQARRSDLLGALHDHSQVIVTTTDLDGFTPEFLAAATCYEVREGIIREAEPIAH
ncbi:MAG: DNA replication/repair protein RecF [Chloroflexi bacterium]|nr:DNA replication/repair protein RecF [Chloroflexota bacterium]MBU1752199.1 DNA replication/repair protein RecF [Chloroflexota bacterium]MBU1877443.1 DNA replication/repair protein RecF [Chloroflexota bacterium]